MAITNPAPQTKEIVILQRNDTNDFYQEIHVSGSLVIPYLNADGYLDFDTSQSFYTVFPPFGGSSISSDSASWSSESLFSFYSSASLSASWASQSFYATSSSWASSSLTTSYISSSAIFDLTVYNLTASWALSSSYAGTSSFITNYITQSITYVSSSDFAISASWASRSFYATSASWSSQSLSASWALTASSFSSISGSNLLYLLCDDGNTYEVTLTNYSGSVIFAIGQNPVTGTNNFLNIGTIILPSSASLSSSWASQSLSASWAPAPLSASLVLTDANGVRWELVIDINGNIGATSL